MSYSSEPLQFSAGLDSMSGGGAVKSAINGYEEFTLDGKNYRVYGSMKGMTPREYIDSWGAPLKRTPPARRSSPPLRRSARIAERKRRASMGGKRRSRKNKKTRKSRK